MDKDQFELLTKRVLAGESLTADELKASIDWLRRDYAGQLGAASSGKRARPKVAEVDIDSILGI